MNYYQHLAFGGVLGYGTQLLFNIPFSQPLSYLSYYGGIGLGSLLPDIDHPRSTLGSSFPFLSVPINKIFGHRGFTHSLLAAGLTGLVTGLLWGQNPFFIGGILLGYFSHLIADMLSPTGIPLLYPNKKRYKFFKRRL